MQDCKILQNLLLKIIAGRQSCGDLIIISLLQPLKKESLTTMTISKCLLYEHERGNV